MRITIVRHGESEYNIDGRLNSDPKVLVPLTKKGIAQADEVRKQLRGEEFDAVYTSELIRTKQTAKIILDGKEVLSFCDGRLNDRGTGLEGKSDKEYQELERMQPDRFTYKHNGGESLEEVYLRAKSFLGDIKKLGYNNVLIVSSSIVIIMLICAIEGSNPRDAINREVSNCEINRTII